MLFCWIPNSGLAVYLSLAVRKRRHANSFAELSGIVAIRQGAKPCGRRWQPRPLLNSIPQPSLHIIVRGNQSPFILCGYRNRCLIGVLQSCSSSQISIGPPPFQSHFYFQNISNLNKGAKSRAKPYLFCWIWWLCRYSPIWTSAEPYLDWVKFVVCLQCAFGVPEWVKWQFEDVAGCCSCLSSLLWKMSVSKATLSLDLASDIVLGSIGAAIPPSKRLDHAVRFFGTWSGSEWVMLSLTALTHPLTGRWSKLMMVQSCSFWLNL